MENYSKQREEILDVFKDSYDHPTAEEIYNRVKQKILLRVEERFIEI